MFDYQFIKNIGSCIHLYPLLAEVSIDSEATLETFSTVVFIHFRHELALIEYNC